MHQPLSVEMIPFPAHALSKITSHTYQPTLNLVTSLSSLPLNNIGYCGATVFPSMKQHVRRRGVIRVGRVCQRNSNTYLLGSSNESNI